MSKAVDSLHLGEVLLTSVRRVGGGKIQIELAEILNERPVSAVSLFNVGDERFSQTKARRAWLSGELAQTCKLLQLPEANITALKEGQSLDLDVLNPQIDFNGEVRLLKVRINETTKPTDWQAANIAKSAKRAGKDGDFITHKGQHIFANTEVVLCKVGESVSHNILEMDKVETTSNVAAAASAIGLSLS